VCKRAQSLGLKPSASAVSGASATATGGALSQLVASVALSKANVELPNHLRMRPLLVDASDHEERSLIVEGWRM
jgi:hypothetical protein